MSETLFHFDESNYRDCQNIFRGENKQEYYLGDLTIDEAENIDISAERKIVGAASIIRLKSCARQHFRRTWAHIRQDSTDLSVLWFLKRGRLCVSTQNGTNIANAGDFVVTRSSAPFVIDCQTDQARSHEVLHVVMPTHALRSYLPDDLMTGFTLRAEGPHFRIAEYILTCLLEDGGGMPADTTQTLFDAALTSIGHAIRDRNVCSRFRQTVLERRLDEVLRFIEVHLANPNLNTTMAAAGCGISARYLSLVLQSRGMSFSKLVWDQRLKKARTWMTTSEQSHVSISEIAYNVGFKSPAHFSRMFKRAYNINPRDFRIANSTAGQVRGAGG